MAQLSSESGEHVNQLCQWRDVLVARAGDVFASDKPAVHELQEATLTSA